MIELNIIVNMLREMTGINNKYIILVIISIMIFMVIKFINKIVNKLYNYLII